MTISSVEVADLHLRGDFDGKVRMRHVKLIRPVFEDVTFRDHVKLFQCVLREPRFLPGARFEKSLVLASSTLYTPRIEGIEVGGDFNCNSVDVQTQYRMFDCTVHERARFWGARFRGWVDIQGCRFLGVADFRSMDVGDGIDFSGCEFRDNVFFRGTSIKGKIDLGDAMVHKRLDLSKSKLHDFAYLENVRLGSAARFAFSNIVAEGVLVRPEQIAAHLGSELDGDYMAASQEYGFLRRNYERLHRYDEEDWAFLRYKRAQRKCRKRTWRRPWGKLAQFAEWLVLDQGCGYATDPFRAVRSAGVVILVFGVMYSIGVGAFDAQLPQLEDTPGSALNTLVFGLVTSVSVFTGGFDTDLVSSASGWMLLALLAEGLLGLLIWGLFIVSFSRKVIR